MKKKLVYRSELEIIQVYRKEIGSFRSRALDAEKSSKKLDTLSHKDRKMEEHYIFDLDKENVRILNSSHFLQKKSDFQKTLLSIKQRFIDNEVASEYPTIMNYRFLNGADSSYALLLKVEEELKQAMLHEQTKTA